MSDGDVVCGSLCLTMVRSFCFLIGTFNVTSNTPDLFLRYGTKERGGIFEKINFGWTFVGIRLKRYDLEEK